MSDDDESRQIDQVTSGPRAAADVSRRKFIALAGALGLAACTRQSETVPAATPATPQVLGTRFGLSVNPFGSMVFSGTRSSRAQILLKLGCLDGWTRFQCEVGRSDRRSAAANDTAYFMDRGYNVVLTILWTTSSPAAPDEASFRTAFADLLNRFGTKRPGLIVVNNEEDQPNHWPRSPSDRTKQDVSRYLEQLSWAAGLAADYGIPVTDGGISTGVVRQTTYVHLLDTIGDSVAAQAYARASANFPGEETALTNPTKLSAIRTKAQEARSFLQGLGPAGAQFCNLHYYQHDAGSFRTAIKAFRDISGLPMVCNERGHRGYQPDSLEAPAIVRAAMQAAVDEELAVVISNSTDLKEADAPNPNPSTPFTYRTRALHDPLLPALRPTGIAHSDMVSLLINV